MPLDNIDLSELLLPPHSLPSLPLALVNFVFAPPHFFVCTSSSSLTSFSFPPRFLVFTLSSFSHFVSVPPCFRLISPSSPPCICPASHLLPVEPRFPPHFHSFFFLWDACSKEGDRDFATVTSHLLPYPFPAGRYVPYFSPLDSATHPDLRVYPEEQQCPTTDDKYYDLRFRPESEYIVRPPCSTPHPLLRSSPFLVFPSFPPWDSHPFRLLTISFSFPP